MANYRRIYEKHYGIIPKDSSGRSYEIHHVDGNKQNNDITNLIAVSIQEHYNIHLSQGDYGACFSIAKRMNLPPNLLSELASKINKGKNLTKEHKQKISKSNSGRIQSEEEKQYRSKIYSGISKGPMSNNHKQK